MRLTIYERDVTEDGLRDTQVAVFDIVEQAPGPDDRVVVADVGTFVILERSWILSPEEQWAVVVGVRQR